MTIKEQLWQEIESSSDELLSETLNFLQYLKNKKTTNSAPDNSLASTGKSLSEHLKTLSNWSGDDLEECFSMVQQTRAQAKFEEFNPLDEDVN